MESLMSDPAMKGMFMVNEDSTDELKTEFFETMKEAEALSLVNDPVSTPYKSKYEAREKLDKLIQKLEAAKTIASLEKKKSTIIEMASRVAACEVKIGTISYECDEPHNAETELNRAASYYFEGFVDKINAICVDNEDQSELPPDQRKPEKFDSSWFPPEFELCNEGEYLDGIRCLNMLGILWSGRGQIKKAFLYLLSAKILYHNTIKAGVPKVFRKSNNVSAAPVSGKADAKTVEELESLYTHTLFYLAQAYGHVQEAEMSCRYCHETLRRQLRNGFENTKSAAEWAKNATSLSDFYLSMGFYVRCYLSIAAAHKILQEKVLSVESPVSECYQEQEADIKRRLARLDLVLMKTVFDREHVLESCRDNGFERDEIDQQEFHMSAINEEAYVDYDPDIEMKNYLKAINAARSKSGQIEQAEEISNDECESGNCSVFGEDGAEPWEVKLQKTFFPCDLTLQPYLKVEDINNFESARTVFLRAVANLESAKKYFVLDGFVTDHVMLLEDHSKLFHYLTVFEKDNKRKLAMETRRLDMLQPIITTLNKSSYENLHKQVSFELGEINLGLLEIKLEKFRNRTDGEVDITSLKKAEITNCNNYCKGALSMFLHFSSLYLQVGGPAYQKLIIPFHEMTLQQLAAVPCYDPDFSLITIEEVRLFLNSHFLACRALQKVIVPIDADRVERTMYLSACQKRYEWLFKMTKTLCDAKGVKISDVFDAEYKLCEEMKNLLPAKIDRMFYKGEAGLSL